MSAHGHQATAPPANSLALKDSAPLVRREARQRSSSRGGRLNEGGPPKRALEAFYRPFAQLSASFEELVPVADA